MWGGARSGGVPRAPQHCWDTAVVLIGSHISHMFLYLRTHFYVPINHLVELSSVLELFL